MAALWLLLFTLALAFITWKWIVNRRRSDNARLLLDKIPGPKGWPILGSALDLQGGNDHILETLHVTWTRDYGEIYRVFVGSSCYVMLSSPELMEVILRSQKIIDKKGRDYEQMVPWLGLGLLLSSGSKWKSRRRLLTPAFHYKILEDFVGAFNEQSRILCGIFDQRRRQCPDGEATLLDVYPLVTRCALDIICEAAMGTRISAQTEDSEYVKAVYRITQIFNERFQSPWLDNDTIFSLSSLGREHNRLLRILHGFTDGVIGKRREQFEQNRQQGMDNKEDEESTMSGLKNRKALLDLLLEASYNCENDEQLTDRDIREEIDTFMFEGHDTVASAMSWFLYCMASHPEYQEKVWEELNEVFKDDLDRDCTLEDLTGLKYLEMCIKEALRLYPSVPVFARWITEEVQIGDHLIPAGCTVAMMAFATHRNPRIYPDPLTYDPERFSPDQSIGRHPYAYLPFSAGPRNCIGQRFAMLEEKAVLSAILRRFRFGLSPLADAPIVSDQIVLKPLKGIHLTLSCR